MHRLGGASMRPRNAQLRQLAFSKPVYSFQVNEDTPPGTPVGQVSAAGQGPVVFSLLEDDGDGLFVLSPYSGKFFLSRGLDYESERYYVLTVEVGRGDVQLSRVRVYFNVMDMNDNPPIFRPDTYSAIVPEDSPVGTCVLALNVSPTQMTGPLDRERVPMYNLTVQVSDLALSAGSRLTSTAHVTVHVEDVNDNAPSFMSAGSLHIPEDTPLRAVVMAVQAVDADSGPSGEVEYGLGNLSAGVFRIDGTSGRLFLERPLDRELSDVLTVLLTARDRGSPRLSTTMNLTVLVEDINDNEPSFPQSDYSVTVREDVSRGTSLLQVRAHDPDLGLNGRVRYRISRTQFSVDPVRGVIVVMDALDREQSPSYAFTVVAVDQGDPPRSATAFINVIVTDVNDCTPVFTPVLLTLHMPENLEDMAQVIHQVSALDEDRGVNSQLTYSIVRGNEEGLFSLSPSGTLRVLHSMDRELRVQHTLHIIAVDSGLPALTGTGTVRILVDDLNDNRPVFTQDVFSTAVSEDIPAGTAFATITASDPDDGVSGQVRYALEEGSVPFSIDEVSGVMFTTGALDRETVGSYLLTVTGSDMHPTHPLVSSATVSVLVEDVNDQWPQFLNGPYVANVPTIVAPGSIVCVVRAVDADTGKNAQLTFSIFGHNTSQLSISPSRGEIFAADVLEGTDDITVSVSVDDGGDDPKADTTTVTVRFQHAWEFPTVTVDTRKGLLSEDEPLGTLVAVVTAESNRTGLVSYYSASGNFGEVFQLHRETGELTIRRPLDYEESEEFLIWVEARDAGLPPFSTYAEIRINISDVNDNSPEFTQNVYRCELFENLPASPVCGVTAVDADSGIYGKVRYSILRGDLDNTFTIDSDTGILRTVQSLDREKISDYNLTIQATDKENNLNTGTAVVLVAVLDTNDHAPRFLQIFFTEIPEDAPVGFAVIQITSTDEDIGANAVSTYTIINHSGSLPFAIDGTSGNIVVVRSLDRETQDRYVVRVNANDSAWSISTDVTIDITDVNDNRPVFSKSSYSVTVTETKAQEVFVMQVHATDSDLGSNKQILYHIEPPSEIFGVNISTGYIQTKQPISLNDTSSLSFIVVASDCGDVPNYSNATVTVTFVRGVNEFNPKFQKSQYNFSVPERSPNRTRVGKVLATDYDLGPDGEVFYLLIGRSKRVGFDIDERSGEIFTAGDLRQHGHSLEVLRILAKNRGSINGSDIDETVVLVNVTDANNPPEFSSTHYTAEVSEDAATGTSVTRVTAKDKDSVPQWRRFVYSVKSGNMNGSFALDPVTGILSVKTLLDRERYGSARVAVTVSDVNDNPPRLISTVGYVRENQPHGTVVSVLNSSDSDLPPNQGPYTYWLVRPVFGSSFSVSPDGVLSTTRPVDRERSPVHSVLVVVQDAGTPPLSSTVTVLVNVLDENDNPSSPRHVYIEVKYYGNSFLGGLIGNVQPEDPDEMDLFNCTIKNGPRNMFGFPFGGCDLWSTPYQGEGTYNITVEANDHLHPSVNNSVYVSYKGFTNASMDNCVLFYVTSPSFEEFLSFSYLKFVKALDSLFNLQASKTHVFGLKNLGDKILLLAAVKTYNGQFLSGEVASGISATQKKLLEAQSGVEISHITGDPCLANPCQNGAVCIKNVHISQDIAVLESSVLMFVSPKQVEIFNCSCLPGFSGTVCESDIDECEEDPCQNGGTCVNYLGGFFCHCLKGFSGVHCHSNVDECQNIRCHNGGTCLNTQGEFHCSCGLGYEGQFCEQFVDPCASSPCLQGICTNLLTGYACVSGANCEEESYGFQELSFMEFPSLDPRNNIISLELATVRQNSLLLYNHGGPSSPEFLALEIVGGKVRLSFDLGSGVVRVETAKMVADGSFHRITTQRTGKVASLQVDSCSADEPHGFCFFQSEGVGSERTLDVSSYNMTFGGVRSLDAILLRATQVRTHDFVGCMRNAKVNNIPLDASRALALYNVLERCPRGASSPCDSTVCQNGGVCHDHWTHLSCDCGDLFTGTNCNTEISEDRALHFNGRANIEYVIKESYRREQQLKGPGDRDSGEMGVEIKLRTTEKDGALVFILGRKGHSALRVMDGKLLYISQDNASSHLTEIAVDIPLVDGRWHALCLFRDGQTTTILLDGLLVMNTTKSTLDLTTVNVHRIVLGGDRPGETINQQPGFSGCVEYFRFEGRVLPFSGFSEMAEVHPSPALVQGGCSSVGPCLPPPCSEEDVALLSCFPWPCPNADTCGAPHWANGSCGCLRNVTDGLCKLCPPRGVSSDICPGPHTAVPLWIVAIVLPLTFVVICLVLLVILLRRAATSRRKKRFGARRLPRRVNQGADNRAFFGEVATSCTNGEQPDVIGAEGRKPEAAGHVVQGCGEAGMPSLQTGLTNSELEYYEIDCASGVYRSDAGSLQLGRHAGEHHSPCTRTETAVKGGGWQHHQDWAGRDQQQSLMRMALAESPPSVPETKTRGCPQTAVSSSRRGHLSQFRHECGRDKDPRHSSHPFTRRGQVPGFVEPPQGLSAEEVRRLNQDLDQQQGHAHSTGMIDSSESESHSSFTCSEYGLGREPSFTGEPGHLREQAASSARRGEMASGGTLCPLQEALPRTEVQRGADNASPRGPQQWESMLNLGLRFETYAQVFEDIAALPIELQNDLDWQSEMEEII
ncbi:hypothetical protein AAFF_G00335950 [Aldrovandia affinis]|uniref:Uncharacterized protein n=1 Tax=Aldrovandia affinis TaxID=143900 RepID=A0AAD7SLA0_9TELE|nr:hypothetical protein AAFF_G00335950 [Aldrovandia affinis]